MFKYYNSEFVTYGIKLHAQYDEDYYDEDLDRYGKEFCKLKLFFGKHHYYIDLPLFLKPMRHKVSAKYWSDKDIKKMGRDWYYTYTDKLYGFSYTPEFDNILFYYGLSNDDSSIDQTSSWEIPWKTYKFSHYDYYYLNNRTLHSYFIPTKHNWNQMDIVEEKVPKIRFQCLDYDSETIEATCYIKEMTWTKGTKSFSWLKYFINPIVRRSIEISFNKKVGRGKGSWKGGTISHGLEIYQNESIQDCFKRYCEMFDLTYFNYTIL